MVWYSHSDRQAGDLILKFQGIADKRLSTWPLRPQAVNYQSSPPLLFLIVGEESFIYSFLTEKCTNLNNGQAKHWSYKFAIISNHYANYRKRFHHIIDVISNQLQFHYHVGDVLVFISVLKGHCNDFVILWSLICSGNVFINMSIIFPHCVVRTATV